jgi:hypothetical protein
MGHWSSYFDVNYGLSEQQRIVQIIYQGPNFFGREQRTQNIWLTDPGYKY